MVCRLVVCMRVRQQTFSAYTLSGDSNPGKRKLPESEIMLGNRIVPRNN